MGRWIFQIRAIIGCLLLLNMTITPAHTSYVDSCHDIEKSLSNDGSNRDYFAASQYVKIDSTIRVLYLFIDFDDHPAKESTPLLKKVSDQISRYFDQVTEEKTIFSWNQESKFLRMSKSIASYDAKSRNSIQSIAQITYDAQTELISESERLSYDLIVVMPPSSIARSEIPTSLAYLTKSDATVNSVIVGADFWRAEIPWLILAHEIGHLFGLPDLYSTDNALLYANKEGSFRSQFTYMAVFDLMNWPTGVAPELTAWSRIRIGALSRERFKCITKSMPEQYVVPVASKTQGIKTIMIPLSPTEVLFVENRQKLGFDQRLESSWTGLIVYKFNSIAESGQGPLRLICRNSKKEVTAANCVLKPGQSLSVEGFLLQNIRNLHNSYLVKVTSDDDTRVYVRNQASVHDRVPVISHKK